MKWQYLLLLMLVILLVFDLANGKRRKNKKKNRQHKNRPNTEKSVPVEMAMPDAVQDEIDMMLLDEAAEEDDEDAEGVESNEVLDELDDIPEDPCAKIHCSAGQECVVSSDGVGTCDCVTECPPEVDPRRHVCSNYNESWNSDCELHRMRCLCTEGRDGCREEKLAHTHIEYYGDCRQMPECVEPELEDFPRRMKDWLFNVMRDMAERKELSEHYLQLEREAEEKTEKRWANGVIWKWCDLNSRPRDKGVSRHELFPIRAPLMSLEHCIAPFLDGCDADSDHYITLEEWAVCLGLEKEEIENKCEDISDVTE